MPQMNDSRTKWFGEYECRDREREREREWNKNIETKIISLKHEHEHTLGSKKKHVNKVFRHTNKIRRAKTMRGEKITAPHLISFSHIWQRIMQKEVIFFSTKWKMFQFVRVQEKKCVFCSINKKKIIATHRQSKNKKRPNKFAWLKTLKAKTHRFDGHFYFFSMLHSLTQSLYHFFVFFFFFSFPILAISGTHYSFASLLLFFFLCLKI